MDTKNTADRLHDIMALADAHAYAKIMPDTPREQRPYFFLRAEIQSLLAENETLRHKLQTLDELCAAGDDVQLLRIGYAAARLEIASLQARVNECGAGAGCCAQAARIAELEAQLEAVGAGGVGPLVGAPAQPVAQWVPVSERLPEPGEAVLLDIGMQKPIRALWAAKHTVETNDDDGEWGEYNEDDDAYYCPEGWYEWNEYEECHFAVDKGAPVAWMELPLPGKVAAPQPAAQAQLDAVGAGGVGPLMVLRQPECWCEDCDTAANSGLRSRMSLCQECGNKRCPRAKHHDNACTASAKPATQPAAQAQAALVIAEAALADIGDADHEPNDDLAWCEARAAQALPMVRAAIAAQPPAQALDAREKLHLDVACAIWEVMREYEDRCDMELEDVGCSHVVWQLANAAIAAQQGDKP